MSRSKRHRNARVHRRHRDRHAAAIPPPLSGIQAVDDDDILEVIELSRPVISEIRIGVDAAP